MYKSSNYDQRELRGYLDFLHEKLKKKYLNSSMLYVVRKWYESGKPLTDVESLAFVVAMYDFQMKVETLKSHFLQLLDFLEKNEYSFTDLASDEISAEARKTIIPQIRYFHRFDPNMLALPLIVKGSKNLRTIAKLSVDAKEFQALPRKLLQHVWNNIASSLSLDYNKILGIKCRKTSPIEATVCILPKPRSNGILKRVHLFLRWVSRDEYPDLGLWTFIPKSKLTVPLDSNISRTLGRVTKGSELPANRKGLREAMDTLRAINPEDPVKYDFILSRPGILGWCKKDMNFSDCDICFLKNYCKAGKTVRSKRKDLIEKIRQGHPHEYGKQVMKQELNQRYKKIRCWTEKTIDHSLRPDVYCENEGIIVAEVKVLKKKPRKVSEIEGPEQIARYISYIQSIGKQIERSYLTYVVTKTTLWRNLNEVERMIHEKLFYLFINAQHPPEIIGVFIPQENTKKLKEVKLVQIS